MDCLTGQDHARGIQATLPGHPEIWETQVLPRFAVAAEQMAFWDGVGVYGCQINLSRDLRCKQKARRAGVWILPPNSRDHCVGDGRKIPA